MDRVCPRHLLEPPDFLRDLEEGLDYVLIALSQAVERLRSFFPVWHKKMAAVSGG